MAYTDYGAILKIDGVFVNKDKGLFADMKESVGFEIDKLAYDGYDIPVSESYFVYAGGEHMLLCFYKGNCLLISDGKIIGWLDTEFLSEVFYLKELPNVKISKLDKVKHKYIEELNFTLKKHYNKNEWYKYVKRHMRYLKNEAYSYRFKAEWEYNGHTYECIYGYGIDPNTETWERIKRDYDFSEKEVEEINKWFK